MKSVSVQRLERNVSWSGDALDAFCKKHGIARLAVFGSATRDGFTTSSDVDVLVSFKPGRTPGLFDLVRMERELSSTVFNGKAIDLRTPDDLSRYFRSEVLANAVYLHDEG